MRNSISALLITAALGLSAAANAGTATTSFQVTASVAATCSATAATLGFGAYTPGSGGLTGNTNVNVKCTKSTAFTVKLDKGTTTGGSITQRLLTDGGGNTLQYNLYTSNTYATVFGDGTAGSQAANGTGAGVATAVWRDCIWATAG